jgi:excisionase family DNA binding protein
MPSTRPQAKEAACASTSSLARYPWERSELALSLCDAAARLGVSRHEVEAMIDAGKVEALPTGFTRTIPTNEIERLNTP